MPLDDIDAIGVRLSELSLRRPRQWGACWLALQLWQQLELDSFWRPRLARVQGNTPWLKVLKTLVAYRLIDPGSEWRLHRQWFDASAMADLLESDFALAERTPSATSPSPGPLLGQHRAWHAARPVAAGLAEPTATEDHRCAGQRCLRQSEKDGLATLQRHPLPRSRRPNAVGDNARGGGTAAEGTPTAARCRSRLTPSNPRTPAPNGKAICLTEMPPQIAKPPVLR